MSLKVLEQKLLIETLWLLLSGLLVLIVFVPFHHFQINFPYTAFNIFFILTAFHVTRWIFTLKYSFFAHQMTLKLLFIFISVAIFLLTYRGLNLYQLFIDENGYYFLFDHLELDLSYRMAFFVNSQYFFFGIWTMVCSIIFPFVLVRSIWKVRNTGME